MRDLNPVTVLSEGLKVNPTASKFILGGLVLFAAGVTISQWQDNPSALIQWAVIVLAGSLIVGVLSVAVMNDKVGILGQVVAWFIVLMIMAWALAFFLAVVRLIPVPASCFIAPLECERLNVNSTQSGETGGPRTTARPADPPASPTGASNYIVYMQFAGFVRSDVEDLTTKLKAAGWRIPGEQRIANNLNVVKYRSAADLAAAQALADGINATNALKKRVTVMLEPSVDQNRLEIWISP